MVEVGRRARSRAGWARPSTLHPHPRAGAGPRERSTRYTRRALEARGRPTAPRTAVADSPVIAPAPAEGEPVAAAGRPRPGSRGCRRRAAPDPALGRAWRPGRSPASGPRRRATARGACRCGCPGAGRRARPAARGRPTRCSSYAALAEVRVAHPPAGVDQVLGRPVLVAEGVPDARSRCPGPPGSGCGSGRWPSARWPSRARTGTRACARPPPSAPRAGSGRPRPSRKAACGCS